MAELTARSTTESEASYVLGSLYYHGALHVPRDNEKAAAALQVAVDAGDPLAITRLGDVRRRSGEHVAALEQYRAAADLGNATAAVQLADYLSEGVGEIQADPDGAVRYYERAIEAGNEGVVLKLANLYLNGARAEDRPKGIDLLQRAFNNEVEGAGLALARAYLAGGETRLAVAAFHAAVDAGDVNAGRSLIRLYVEGRSDLRRDVSQARAVLDQIASQLDENVLAFETLFVEVASRPPSSSYQQLTDRFKILSSNGKSLLLSRIFSLDRNAYVLFMQSQLADLGYFQGTPNGLLTASTISAFNAACTALNISQECRTGPLSYNARRASQRAFFQNS